MLCKRRQSKHAIVERYDVREEKMPFGPLLVSRSSPPLDPALCRLSCIAHGANELLLSSSLTPLLRQGPEA